jgi:NAD-dependent SIR2 family protein deacetylase
MGVDSGLPDFRGTEGFWRAYPPLAKLGLRFEEMADPRWFGEDPELAWAFYGHRLNLYRQTAPHEGFSILCRLIEGKDGNGFVFTSNVDGQFQKAGFDNQAIYEVHGSIHHLQCLDNCTDAIWPNEEEIPVDMERFRALRIPRCPRCGAVARPNILMFGDWGWNSNRSEAQAIRFGAWLKANERKPMAIIEIGAGTAIPTVRRQGEALAADLPQARLIRINPREAQIDERLGWSLPLGGLEGLRLIAESV